MKFKFIGSRFDIMLKATYLNSLPKTFTKEHDISEWIIFLPPVGENMKITISVLCI